MIQYIIVASIGLVCLIYIFTGLYKAIKKPMKGDGKDCSGCKDCPSKR